MIAEGRLRICRGDKEVSRECGRYEISDEAIWVGDCEVIPILTPKSSIKSTLPSFSSPLIPIGRGQSVCLGVPMWWLTTSLE